MSLRDIPRVGQKIDDYTRDDINGNYHASVKVQPNSEMRRPARAASS